MPTDGIPTPTTTTTTDLFDAGEWPGVSCVYAVTPRGAGAGAALEIAFSVDPAVVPDEAGESQEIYDRYGLVCDQFGAFDGSCRLTAPHLEVEVDTAGTLAGAPMAQDAGGMPLVALVGAFLCQARRWIGGRREGRIDPVPQLTLTLPIDPAYPLLWSGDLQELAVQLTLTSTLALPSSAPPRAHTVTTRVGATPSPRSATDPTGLAAFAAAFEAAYDRYDGGTGRLKVAAGVDVGAGGVWAMRWGSDHGASVRVLHDGQHPAAFYALPPLGPQLITRPVDRLRRYQDKPGATSDAYDEVSLVLSDVDLDAWAAAFLESLERLSSVHAPLAAAKSGLAESIAATIVGVFEPPNPASDPPSARETLRQALLDSLDACYRVSAVAQAAASVGRHGVIEQGSDPWCPPQIAGRIAAAGVSPPSGSRGTRLPLRDGDPWLNVPVAAADPAAQRAVDLHAYEMGFVEHAVQASDDSPGGVSSSWLTFVLQRDAATAGGNTLTAPLGHIRVPIPLRLGPAMPALIEASATQDTPEAQISSLAQAMTWRYSMAIQRPQAAQDTLNVQIVFNEPAPGERAAPQPSPATPASAASRPAPADLFEALARHAYEYPQLLPYLSNGDGGGANTDVALARFIDLAAGVAGTWAAWEPPESSDAPLPPESAQEVWTYSVDRDEDEGRTLRVTASSIRSGGTRLDPRPGPPPWPEIQGYAAQPHGDGDRAIYTLSAAAPPEDLSFSWGGLFVLDCQSAHGRAWIERNRNLAGPGQITNPRLVRRSSVRSFPTQVPFVRATAPIPAAALTSLDAALQSLLLHLRTAPSGSPAGAGGTALRIAYALSYSFTLSSAGGLDLRTSLPLSRGRTTIEPGQDGLVAAELAGIAADWKRLTNPSLDGAMVALELTVFATSIAADGRDRPLAHLSDIAIVAPADPAWWAIGD